MQHFYEVEVGSAEEKGFWFAPDFVASYVEPSDFSVLVSGASGQTLGRVALIRIMPNAQW